MSQNKIESYKENISATPQLTKSRVVAAIIAALPLSLSVVPWGILCGTLSIEAGMSSIQAQLMSLLIFAGAAQIAGISIMGAAGGWLTLFNSTTLIGVRHMLYSAAYKDNITPLPWYKRFIFAFLLTDEMFVLAQADQMKTGYFDYWFAVITGFTFYVVWNSATLFGIMSAHLLPNIESLGFDFAIAATFIAMVFPMVKSKPLGVAVVVSGISSYLLEHYQIDNGLLFAALLGMAVGAFLTTFEEDSTSDNELLDKKDDAL